MANLALARLFSILLGMICTQVIVLGLIVSLNDLSTGFKIEEESDLGKLFGKREKIMNT